MQRFINDPDNIVDECIKGFVKAYPERVKQDKNNPRVVISTHAPVKGKVGIVTGGGAGHEPAFMGYVGRNMIDAVAIGELFSSPTAKSFKDAIIAADGGVGVAVLYGNYAGDNMNVKMAKKMINNNRIEVQTVIANDDVCSAPLVEREKRRGVAGEIFMWKIASAKATQGASLNEVCQIASKTIDNCRSVGIGLAPCTLPTVGHPNFEIKHGTMEIGIGHHGEPGILVAKLESANNIANKMTDLVLNDHNLTKGSEVAVLVSGLGATPVNEQYILYNRIHEKIKARGLKIYKSYIGNYFTSLEMVGATLTILALDDELKQLLDTETNCLGF